jgi:hypothetical protein
MPSDRHESNYRLNHYSESTTRPPFCEVAVAMARLVLNCGGVDLVMYKLGNVTTIGRAPLNQIVIDKSRGISAARDNRKIGRVLSAKGFAFNKRDTSQ